jgi:glutamate carboxypeptidase
MNLRRAEGVLSFVQGQQQALIDLLQHMVEAESPSSHPESHRLMRTILRQALESIGFKVIPLRRDGRVTHLYARPQKRRKFQPSQLLVGHFDTVWPLGTVAHRPFTVDGNIVRGPGVFDMKGGLVQIVIALKALQHLSLEPELLPVIFVNADEEIGSRTSTRYVRTLAQHVSRAFVMEPAMGEQGIIKTERKGIGRFTITVHGKAAHAGLDPEGGASAILELSHVIQTLFAYNDADSGITVNVGMVDGGLQPNVIAPHSQAVVDVRVPTNADGEHIERAIHGLTPVTPGVRLSVEGRIGRPSMERTARNDALWQQASGLGKELGIDLQQGRAGGGSDGNTTSQYTATLDGLGPVGDGAHAEHEFLYIDKTLERTALLALLLLAPPADALTKGDER